MVIGKGWPEKSLTDFILSKQLCLQAGLADVNSIDN